MESHKAEFEKRTALLNQWGVDFHCEQEWRPNIPPQHGASAHNLPFFRTIQLPFSADEWCDICMRGGEEYLGGCCSLLSGVQDIMNTTFRDGGVMDAHTVAVIADAMKRHGDDADCEERDEQWESFGGDPQLFQTLVDKRKNTGMLFLGPMEKIRYIWHVIDGFYAQESTVGRWSPLDEPEASFLTLSDKIFMSSMRRLFDQDIQAERTIFEGTDLAQIAHALAITEKVVPDDFEWEGFCLYDTDRERVAQTSHLCLYETEEEALKYLEPYKNHYEALEIPERAHKPLRHEVLVVRKIRITKAGTELLVKT